MSTDPREFEHPIDGSHTPTPEAIEAAERALEDAGVPNEHKAARLALAAAAPFIAAHAKAEALREAAESYYAGDKNLFTLSETTPQWLRVLASNIGEKVT